jgi:hypothetical protein
VSDRARAVPVEGKIDTGQLSALLRLLLGQGLRAGVDLSSGVKGHPLKQLVTSMTFMGLLFAMNVVSSSDWTRALVVLYFGTMLLVLLAVVPETQEARNRHIEILGSKPITRRTMFVARGAMLAIVGTLISSSFALGPIVAAWIRFRVSWAEAVAGYVGVLLTAFVAAVMSFVAIMFALQVWPPERVRRLSQTGLIVFLVTVSFSSVWTLPQALQGRRSDRFAALGSALEWSPSTWMVRLVAGGGPHRTWSAVGAVLVIAAAVLLGSGGVLERFLPSLVDTMPPPEARVRPPLVCRALRQLARLPGVRHVWLNSTVTALADTMMRSARSEDLSRVRGVSSLIMGAGVFALTFAGFPTFFAASMLLYLIVVGCIEGARMARQSTTPEAAWIFRKAPLPGLDLLRAITTSVLMGGVALPALLLAVLELREYPPLLGLLLATGYGLGAIALVIAVLAVDPGLPLSREPTASSFWGIAASIGVGSVLLGVVGVLRYAVAALGSYGALMMAIIDVLLILASLALGLIAVARLESTIADA